MRTVIIFRNKLLEFSETFIREQARALTRWHPILVGERFVEHGLPLNGMATRLLEVPHGGVSQQIYGTCHRYGLPYPPHLRRLFNLRPSLIHAHFGFDGVQIAPYARALRLPLLITLHGYDINMDPKWWRSGKGGNHRRDYPEHLLALVKQPRIYFLAVSEAIRQRAIDRGIPEGRISVSYIGVDTRYFRPNGLPLAARARRVLFVGRFVEKKGPLLLVQAFSEVQRRLPDAELVMIGDGPLRPAAEALATELGLRVTFTGAISQDQVLAQMHCAQALCLPSVRASNGDAEGLPISILEAQACGVPVVTTRHSGNPEGLQDGVTGKIVKEGNIPALAGALEKLLSQEIKTPGLPGKCVDFVSTHFSLERCAYQLENSYGQHCHK